MVRDITFYTLSLPGIYYMEPQNWITYYKERALTLLRPIGNWTKNRWQKSKTWLKAQPRWKLAMLALVTPVVCGLVFVLLLALFVRQGVFGALPSYTELENIRNYQASEVYGEDNILLGRYYVENRINADLQDLPADLINGLVATEDARFFEHNGIDMRAYARVFVKSLLLNEESAGGGSTISQQLAKNLYPRVEYAILSMPINKLREMFIARRLEKLYSKEDILRLYLNTVPFGDNSFGIKVAAQRFFNKSPQDLRTEEAAVLIGMLKANTRYNPMRNPDAAKTRRNTVLAQMNRYGYIDSLQLDTLRAKPLEITYQAESHNLGLATYFREHLRQEIETILKDHPKPDGSAYNVYTDGLKVYTTIDAKLQEYAEAAVRDYLPDLQQQFSKDWGDRAPWGDEATLQKYVERTSRYRALKDQGLSKEQIDTIMATPVQMTVFDWKKEAVTKSLSPLDSLKFYLTLLNTGLLSAEPNTGLIRAWVGGSNHRFIQYDHIKSQRQIGSIMKPIVYATALQNGMLPCEYTPNELKRYDEYKGWEPHNSEGEYGGLYSMEGALSKSINTIAVEVALRAGIGSVRKMASDMGISGEIPPGPAIALGTVEASLLDMVTVYSTFANRGRRPTRLHYLDAIVTAKGDTVVAFDRPDAKDFPRVLGLNAADMAIRMMESVVDSGTARRARYEYNLWGDIAGKTGTTQDQSDGWFMGFTPKLVTGVWVGAENAEIHFRRTRVGQGSNSALPIWGRYMRSIWQDKSYRWVRAGFAPLSDSLAAYMKCPFYLPDVPAFAEDWLIEDPDGLNRFGKEVEGLTPEQVERYMQEVKRRDNEDLGEYGARIRREAEREARGEDRQEERRNFWDRLLFGKKKKDGDDGG